LSCSNNFLYSANLQAVHPHCLAGYEAAKASAKRPAVAEPSTSVKKTKQDSVDALFKKSHTKASGSQTVITKRGLEEKLVSFVANGLLPLSIVDSAEFRDLVCCEYLLKYGRISQELFIHVNVTMYRVCMDYAVQVQSCSKVEIPTPLPTTMLMMLYPPRHRPPAEEISTYEHDCTIRLK
jgi:hypothetical protein